MISKRSGGEEEIPLRGPQSRANVFLVNHPRARRVFPERCFNCDTVLAIGFRLEAFGVSGPLTAVSWVDKLKVKCKVHAIPRKVTPRTRFRGNVRRFVPSWLAADESLFILLHSPVGTAFRREKIAPLGAVVRGGGVRGKRSCRGSTRAREKNKKLGENMFAIPRLHFQTNNTQKSKENLEPGTIETNPFLGPWNFSTQRTCFCDFEHQ